MDYNKTICAVVKEAITKGELPASAINLIVDNPRTSSFYMLPKIHKPGNPGRPIVSACNCPTELIATYLDVITTPLVQRLPSYVKDTNHMLRIVDSFRFPGTSNYVFTMDVKSLYTVIPNGDGLLALTHFLNKRPVLQPPTHTLVRLAELVLTLNTFSFNGNFYRQTGGVAMESRLGTNYACPFMGHVGERNQPCTNDISMTSWVPLSEVEMRLKFLQPMSTVFIPASSSPGSFRMYSCLSLTFV